MRDAQCFVRLASACVLLCKQFGLWIYFVEWRTKQRWIGVKFNQHNSNNNNNNSQHFIWSTPLYSGSTKNTSIAYKNNKTPNNKNKQRRVEFSIRLWDLVKEFYIIRAWNIDQVPLALRLVFIRGFVHLHSLLFPLAFLRIDRCVFPYSASSFSLQLFSSSFHKWNIKLPADITNH